MEAHLSPRGRCIALIPYYAGARISEVVRLDVDDIQMSARKGRLRLYGKGGKFREVDIHPKLRTELQLWLDERPNWPHADDNRALPRMKRIAQQKLVKADASDQVPSSLSGMVADKPIDWTIIAQQYDQMVGHRLAAGHGRGRAGAAPLHPRRS
ncbi:tyrosine-type recombinase/integrase [Nonomuraea sp. NPDC001636]|uniref:tyrosine-type recombinase/integrase n=1 Tax=Nonomuraea sp. NPDC001636 TaxID=3154391 RepID=UPI00332A3A66